MKLNIIHMTCKKCKKITRHASGTSVGGKNWTECLECGEERET